MLIPPCLLSEAMKGLLAQPISASPLKYMFQYLYVRNTAGYQLAMLQVALHSSRLLLLWVYLQCRPG